MLTYPNIPAMFAIRARNQVYAMCRCACIRALVECKLEGGKYSPIYF